MNDLKLTPARLDVLKGVAAGEVKHYPRWGRGPDENVWQSDSGSKTVNGVVGWLKDARLIRLGRASGPSMFASKPWELTEAGEKWLAENAGEN